MKSGPLKGIGWGLLVMNMLLLLRYYGYELKREVVLTPEQQRSEFNARQAEQNRQAEVMSGLRASEKGDIALLLDGEILAVYNNEGGIVTLCRLGSCDSGMEISQLAKRVDKVFKADPSNLDWKLATQQFLLQR